MSDLHESANCLRRLEFRISQLEKENIKAVRRARAAEAGELAAIAQAECSKTLLADCLDALNRTPSMAINGKYKTTYGLAGAIRFHLEKEKGRG